VSSPRPGGGNAPKVLEDLQHDIEVIGDIVGKVSSLRRKYRVSGFAIAHSFDIY